MKKISIYFLLIAFPSISMAQELSHAYYSYLLNTYNVNPAYTGYSENLEAVLYAKNHMSGIKEAPKNLMFGISSPINTNQNMGGRILSDSRGAFKMNKIDLTYSHLLKINEEHSLTFGVSAGFLNRNFNASSINKEYLDETDPTLMENYMNESIFVMGAGFLYQYKDLEVGISSPHLLEDLSEFSKYQFVNVAYKHQIEESDFQLQPMIFYQNIALIKNKMDIILRGIYAEKVWAQIGYQTPSAISFGLGFDLEHFSAGYVYEKFSSELSNISNGSNQIMIKLSFGNNKPGNVETLEQKAPVAN